MADPARTPSPSAIGDADDAHARALFLARASQELASSLDTTMTMTSLARIAVPAFADLAVVFEHGDGRLRHVAEAAADPAAAGLLASLRSTSADGELLRGIIDSKRTAFFADVGPELIAALGAPPDAAATLLALAPRSVVIIPMLARGELVGVLAAAMSSSGRSFGAADRELFEDVARRAAVALDHARLYEEARRTTERIERLHAVTVALSEALTPAEVVATAIDHAFGALESYTGAVWILGDDGHAALVGARGWEPLHYELFRRVPVGAPSPVGHTLATGEAVWCGSRAEFAGRFPRAAAAVRDAALPDFAVASLPLVVEGKLTGAMALSFTGGRHVWRQDRELLETLARQCAQALRRAMLYDEAQSVRSRLEGIIGASPLAVAVLDLDGTIRHWNPTAEAIFGWSAAEVLGRIPPFVDEADAAELRAILARVEAGHPLLGVETRRRTRRGDLRDLSLWTARVIAPDGRVQCLAMVADVTERKQAEAAAARAAERTALVATVSETLAASLDYEATLRNVIDLCLPALGDFGFFDVVEGDDVRRVARAHEDPRREAILAGSRWQRSDRTDLNLCALSSGAPAIHPRIDRAWLERVAVSPGHLAVMEDLAFGSMLTVPLRYHGEVLGALTLFFVNPGRQHDEDHLQTALEVARPAAAALVNARLYRDAQAAVRMRDDFLSIASHELRTPLTSIDLHVASLLRALETGVPPDPTRMRSKLARASGQLKRLSGLIAQLLDVSRLAASRLVLEVEPVDLGALVREVLGRFEDEAAGTGASLVLHAEDAVTGSWDRRRLDQVITNLISNALKYGGARPVVVTVARQDDHAVLTVRDEGVGIDPDDHERIFERFERGVSARHYGGIGLGLWIVKEIVELHEGRVAVESRPGAGATFTIELPLAPRTRPTA